MRPSEFYDCAEQAVRDICHGCANERGWATFHDPVGLPCMLMIDIQNDEDALAMKDGRPRCPGRRERE